MVPEPQPQPLLLDSLPRDLQIRVCRQFCSDMDSRIRAGLVFRMRVPPEVAERIGRALVKPIESTTRDGLGALVRRITSISFPAAAPRFMIRQVHVATPEVTVDNRNVLSYPSTRVYCAEVHTIWWESSAFSFGVAASPPPERK